jgi:hypothetical protein
VRRRGDLSDQDDELVCSEGFNEGFRGWKVAVDGADADVGCLRDGVELHRFPITRQSPRSFDDAATVARGVLAQCALLRADRAVHAFTLPR